MIVNRQRRVAVDEAELTRFARALDRALHLKPESYTAALVSDARSRHLNRRYRGVARPTDVLSFPAGMHGGGNGYLGDVAIAAGTARRQARRYRHGLEEEIELLLLHGVLHLLGFDHETDDGRMNRREHALRRRLGLE